ncbi:MAG: alpha/beta fold hydrolase [Burkholderiales bacterium]|jgi:phospholipase/carboxylesterase|nr:alpha/beta fold hydrolase [Burkholderiales bacterium]
MDDQPSPFSKSLHLVGDSTVRHDGALSYEFVPARRSSAGKPPLLVLLHGGGANEGDLLGLVPYLDERLQIVSARAPNRIEAGAYSWFRTTFTAGGPIVHEGQEGESRKALAAFIDEVIGRHGADAERVYLLGFSQGATVALSFALTVPDEVAGVIAVGGRLLREVLPTLAPAVRTAGLPLFLAHGLHDDVVPIGRARANREFLLGLDLDLTYREYPAGHQIAPQALTDLAAWLGAQLDAPRRAHGA